MIGLDSISPPELVAGAGLLFLFVGIYTALSLRRSRRYGRLRSVDLPSSPGQYLRSERWRLAGRPDEIRERSDGTWIPIEVKSRTSPAGGPPASHRAQVAAYCLLIEEATGRAPPYGVLRYSDGGEFRVPWDAQTRNWLWSLRSAMDRPYRGEATPSPGRCRGCTWRSWCDRSAA